MLPHKSLRRADIVASSAMICLGAGVILAAARMPWNSNATGSSSSQWYISPGLFPAVIGGLLILFNLRVLLTAFKEGGSDGLWTATVGWFRGLGRNRPIHRVLLITALMSLYVFVGIGRVNFLLASGVFLFVTIALFWWGNGEGKLTHKIPLTAVVAVGVPYLFTYLFYALLYVPMP